MCLSALVVVCETGDSGRRLSFGRSSKNKRILSANSANYWLILLPVITVSFRLADGMMLLSILARHQTVSLLKILYEVAFVVHADLDDDLLIGEERRLQQFARLFDSEFLEIADRRHACFRLKQMLQARVGEIHRRRHPADRQMPVKISTHRLYYFNYSWIHVPKMSFRYRSAMFNFYANWNVCYCATNWALSARADALDPGTLKNF